MSFAKRIDQLKEEGAYAVLERSLELEAKGREIIHLEIGQPDFETSSNISMAGIQAIANGKTRYNPPSGIPQLREVIAKHVSKSRGVNINGDQVVIGPGAKPLILFPMLAILEPGDEVIYPNPGFPTYEAGIRLTGATPVDIPLVEDRGFDLDIDVLLSKANPKTKMIILNSPSNPTGGILSSDTLVQVARLARRYDCWILSDEIYSSLVYDREAPSIISLPGMRERTILVDGFSKTYSMTGWRLGYGVMPRSLAKKTGLLLTHSVGCTATFTQYAGIEAIEGSQVQVEAMRSAFQQRRDIVVKGLNEIPGVQCATPYGAFYAFPNIEAFNRSPTEIANYLLEEAGVALLPGTAFGSNGNRHLRISYANSKENLRIALDRINVALGKLN